MDPPWRDTGTKTRPKSRSQEEPRPEDVLGQISYGPATQTTVVTTTTTTTTNFPPFVLKAPQYLHDLDPKQYPLAASPTPQSIKKLCFEVEGKPTIFEEADDTLDTIEKVGSIMTVGTEIEQADLYSSSRSNGKLYRSPMARYSPLPISTRTLKGPCQLDQSSPCRECKHLPRRRDWLQEVD